MIAGPGPVFLAAFLARIPGPLRYFENSALINCQEQKNIVKGLRIVSDDLLSNLNHIVKFKVERFNWAVLERGQIVIDHEAETVESSPTIPIVLLFLCHKLKKRLEHRIFRVRAASCWKDDPISVP